MILDKIYCPEEQRERADKALRLNGFTGPPLPKTRAKTTIRIKRFPGKEVPPVNDAKPKLQSASSNQSKRFKQSVEEHLALCELCRRVVQMGVLNMVTLNPQNALLVNPVRC